MIPLRSGECDRHIRHATNIAACSIVVLVSSDIGQHLFVAATKCDHYIFGLIIRLSQLQLTRCRHCQGRGRVSQLRHLFCLSRIIHPNVRRSPQFIRHTAQLELLRCTCAGVDICAEGGSICQIEALRHRAAADHGRGVFALGIVVVAAIHRAAVLSHQTAACAGDICGGHTILHRAGLQRSHQPSFAAADGHILNLSLAIFHHAEQVAGETGDGCIAAASAIPRECPLKGILLRADGRPVDAPQVINACAQRDGLAGHAVLAAVDHAGQRLQLGSRGDRRSISAASKRAVPRGKELEIFLRAVIIGLGEVVFVERRAVDLR